MASERAVANAAPNRSQGLIPAEELKAIVALDTTLRDGQRSIQEADVAGNMMLKGLMTARLTQTIRNLITPAMMRDIMCLKGTPLGFKTDEATRREGPYTEDAVRDVVIAALMDGARLVGNEFNIISSNYYRTKEQLERKVREFPGLREFRYSLSVPKISDGGALVAGWASWKLHGTADRMDFAQSEGFDGRIPVRINSGQGADAILGKGTRKLMYRVLQRLTGIDYGLEEEQSEPEAPDVVDARFEIVSEEQVDHQQDDLRARATEEIRGQFAACNTPEEADGILADVIGDEWDDEFVTAAKQWHSEAVARLSTTDLVVEHDAVASHPLAGVRERMQAAELKNDVKAIYEEAIAIHGLSDEDKNTLYQWRGQELARIHGTRGERTNGKAAAAK